MSSGFAWAPEATLRTRTSVKWRLYPEDVLPLWVAEMDVEMAPAVERALTDAIRRGDTGYPFGTDYALALAEFAKARWNWELPTERTAIVPDVMIGITEILRLITEPGDEVVVTPPVYPPFYAFPTSAGRRVIEAPLTPQGRLDLDTLAEAFSQATVFLLSNPHNPTGAVHTRDELESVAALAREHDVRIISDEIHGPLVLPGATFTPLLTVAGAENAFAVTSASKAWNLAGLKAGLVIAGEEARADLARLPEEVSHGPSHLGIIAHVAALRDDSGWLDDLLTGLVSNRSLLTALVDQQLPAVGYRPGEATYLAWLDCRALGFEDAAAPGAVGELSGPARFFREKALVGLNSGHVFGTGGAGHVRLNFATSPDILTKAVERMAAALSDRDGPTR